MFLKDNASYHTHTHIHTLTREMVMNESQPFWQLWYLIFAENFIELGDWQSLPQRMWGPLQRALAKERRSAVNVLVPSLYWVLNRGRRKLVSTGKPSLLPGGSYKHKHACSLCFLATTNGMFCSATPSLPWWAETSRLTSENIFLPLFCQCQNSVILFWFCFSGLGWNPRTCT